VAEKLRANSLSNPEFSRRLYGTISFQAHASVESERALPVVPIETVRESSARRVILLYRIPRVRAVIGTIVPTGTCDVQALAAAKDVSCVAHYITKLTERPFSYNGFIVSRMLDTPSS
jgi:hypothetical protein